MKFRDGTWSNSALLASLIYVFGCVSSLQIIVQFDGSLRPPNDFGIPTSMLGKMAACACTISRCTADSDEQRLLVMGGKCLTVTSKTTSGEVEYEGLLFALKSLRTYIEAQSNDDEESISSILILGDCKTIIDQMNGKSSARKLEQFYTRALAEIDALARESNHQSPIRNLQFHHTPRSNNVICDNISASIVMYQQYKAFDDACSDLLKKAPGESSTDVIGFLEKWFQDETSLIPISRRLSLYRYMAEIAMKQKDYHGLHEVGSRYENDVRILGRTCGKENKQHCVSADTTLKAEAVSYQMCSLNGLGRKNEALRLHTRHRYLLHQCSSTMMEIEAQKLDVDNLPGRATTMLLKTEIYNTKSIHLRKTTDWSVPVQQWYDEMIASRTWKDHREMLIMP